MAILSKTDVMTGTEIEETQVKRVRSFLWFKSDWWETVSTRTMGNDVHVQTTNEIRAVYVNGIEYLPHTGGSNLKR